MQATRSRKFVLAIEDDEDIRAVYVDACQLEGYSVATARNGSEAIALFERGCRPSLVLLDMSMPVMNGLEFLEWLDGRKDSIGAIPVIVISAHANDYSDAVTRYGSATMLAKPFDFGEFLECVRERGEPASPTG